MNAMYYLKIKIPNTIYRIAQFLEILVSLLVIAAIILSFGTILSQLGVIRPTRRACAAFSLPPSPLSSALSF